MKAEIFKIPAFDPKSGNLNTIIETSCGKELDGQMMWELEKFFIFQHTLQGEQFKVLEIVGPKKAMNLVKQARSAAK